MRILPILVAAATLLAFAPLASAEDLRNFSCVTLSTGETACGSANSFICSGAGAGVATGLVSWKLVITTSNVYSQKVLTYPVASPVFADGGLAAICTTATCTFTALYANDELVNAGLGVC